MAEVAQIHGNKKNIRLGKAIISVWAACPSIFQTTFLLSPKKHLSLFSLKHAKFVEKIKKCAKIIKKRYYIALFHKWKSIIEWDGLEWK